MVLGRDPSRRRSTCCSIWAIPPAITILIALALILLDYFVWSIGRHQPPITMDYIKTHGPIVNNTMRREVIMSAFQFAWDGYNSYAFPHDVLKPVSNTAGRSRNDWGTTAIDALGTAILMGKGDIVKAGLHRVKDIDFGSADTQNSIFDTTSVYMGALLSAHELLTGPFNRTFADWHLDTQVLLKQAVSLGDLLIRMIRSGAALWPVAVPPEKSGPVDSGLIGLTQSDTLLLEWSKLSNLTGNPEYRWVALAVETALAGHTVEVNGHSSKFVNPIRRDTEVTRSESNQKMLWSGSATPYYRSLLRLSVYDRSMFATYWVKWRTVAEMTMKSLASSPQQHPNITFLGSFDTASARLVPESGPAQCSVAADFLLGGQQFDDFELVVFGLQLVDACHHVYESTRTHIGPKTFRWTPAECANSTLPQSTPAWRCDKPPLPARDFADQNGFWIDDASYSLTAEVVEAYYYAYRETRHQKYRDWAWEAWSGIDNSTRLSRGYSSIENVDAESEQLHFTDSQEGYFFSKTLKYLYLIFDWDAQYQVSWRQDLTRDAWVFTSGGHPFRTVFGSHIIA